LNDTTAQATHRQFAEPEISIEARAERVLAEYLRQWGLRDPTTIAAHCRRWVRQAVERAGSQSEQQPAVIYQAAVAAAVAEIDGWLDHLAMLASSNRDEAHARRGLLAMEVQTLIDKYPAALLSHDSLPAPLVQQLRRAAHSAMPAAHLMPMRAQPLGRWARPLGWRWWRQGMSRMFAAAALWLRLARPERGAA
jgi:hypothetical protein